MSLTAERHTPLSTFTWLDFSEADQRSMQQVVDLFRDKDTRDELGLGSVRDALSDLLLPGTSTIQTRARYFLFVPWIMQHLARGHGPKTGTLAERLRVLEGWLIASLGHGGVGPREGLIGRRTQQRTKRMPSAIYWQGLSVWGIRQWDGSIDSVLRGNVTAMREPLRLSDDGDYVAGAVGPWNLALPEPPKRFFNFEGVDFNLTVAEAAFLRDSIQNAVPDSLLTWLVLNASPTDVPYLWLHPQRSEFTAQNQAQLVLAERFSKLMYGASLLYGRLLAEKRPDSEMRDAINATWSEWFATAKPVADTWAESAFWQAVHAVNPRISTLTRTFVAHWIAALQNAKSLAELDTPVVHQLIIDRERLLKGQLARLSNPHAYEVWVRAVAPDWRPFQLDYRWQTFQLILDDILTPLESNDA